MAKERPVRLPPIIAMDRFVAFAQVETADMLIGGARDFELSAVARRAVPVAHNNS